MEEKKRQLSPCTYVEFFDHAAVENICACLAQAPERVVLIGDDEKVLEHHCGRYQKIFDKRGFQGIDFKPQLIEAVTLQSIVEGLSQVVETYENCVFGLTGGDDLYLVAMGIVCERYRDKSIKMHRFLLSEGDILDCDQDGVTVAQNRQPKLTVEENIRLYGGKVVYDEELREATHRWNMSEEFKEDLKVMWDICCTMGNREWNEQMSTLQQAIKLKWWSGEQLSVSYNQLRQAMAREGETPVFNAELLSELQTKGLLLDWYVDDNILELTFKNDQVKRCLTVAGQVLELMVYMTALESKDAEGNKIYNNSMTGVYIDWDGITVGEEAEQDSHNEVDVLMMHGVVPVFVSCKNGYVKVDELYKLNVVAQQFGSSYAKKVLVAPALDTYGDQGLYILNRAKDMNIQVVREFPHDDEERRIEIVSSFWNYQPEAEETEE